MTVHPIEAVYDKNSRVLILGSFPSVKSRADGFYYAHPGNRFWKVLASVTEAAVPETKEGKTEFLHKNKIALWDVIKSCDVEGSSDSSIKNVTPNDIEKIIAGSNIKKIFINGKTAEKYYKKYIEDKTGIEYTCLPSTSPANAAYSLMRLINEWAVIKAYI